NAGELAQAIADGSRFVTATGPADADRGTVPKKLVASGTAGGPDGAQITTTEVAAGLSVLENQAVNILVVAGMDANTGAGTVLAHLEATENEGRERMAVMGASSDEPSTIISNDSTKASNPRFILVAPGIAADDAARAGEANTSVKLPASYAAALIA